MKVVGGGLVQTGPPFLLPLRKQRRGEARLGMAWLGMDRLGKARQGFYNHGIIDTKESRLGQARQGKAWPGMAGRGWVRQGKDFTNTQFLQQKDSQGKVGQDCLAHQS